MSQKTGHKSTWSGGGMKREIAPGPGGQKWTREERLGWGWLSPLEESRSRGSPWRTGAGTQFWWASQLSLGPAVFQQDRTIRSTCSSRATSPSPRRRRARNEGIPFPLSLCCPLVCALLFVPTPCLPPGRASAEDTPEGPLRKRAKVSASSSSATTGGGAPLLQERIASTTTAAGPHTEPLPRKRYALIIGNNNYDFQESGYLPLCGSESDADGMTAALGALGFKCRTRKNLTRAGILEGMRWLKGKMEGHRARHGEGCTAILYFAGHGEHVHGIDVLVGVDDQSRYCHKVPMRVCMLFFSCDASFPGALAEKSRFFSFHTVREFPTFLLPLPFFFSSGAQDFQVCAEEARCAVFGMIMDCCRAPTHTARPRGGGGGSSSGGVQGPHLVRARAGGFVFQACAEDEEALECCEGGAFTSP